MAGYRIMGFGDWGAATVSAFVAASVFASAALAQEPAACTPPTPHPPMTVEMLRNQGGDARPEAAAFVNALFAHDDCLHAIAWRMRGARGSIPAVARRVQAECRATFDAYIALEVKLAPTPAALAEARRDGARKDAGIARTYVDEARECR